MLLGNKLCHLNISIVLLEGCRLEIKPRFGSTVSMETKIYATNFSNYYFALSILIGVALMAVGGFLEGLFSIHVTKVKN